jgi:hypothetical protein
LNWPTRITETEFFNKVKAMAKSKTLGFLDIETETPEQSEANPGLTL